VTTDHTATVRKPVHPRDQDRWAFTVQPGLDVALDASLCIVVHTPMGTLTVSDAARLANALEAARQTRDVLEAGARDDTPAEPRVAATGEPTQAPAACLHTGCHLGRCAYAVPDDLKTRLSTWLPGAITPALREVAGIIAEAAALRGDEAIGEVAGEVNAARYARWRAELVAAVRAELGNDENTRWLRDDKFGPPVKVVFPTWDWDNGWFFQESAGRVFNAAGEETEIAFTDKKVDGLLADLSGAYALGQASIMTIDLIDASVDVE
jgi:hypothetical protein